MNGKKSIESKLREYYSSGNYKGFHKIQENAVTSKGVTGLTFSNGEKHIFTSGRFREEALANMFIKVDAL